MSKPFAIAVMAALCASCGGKADGSAAQTPGDVQAPVGDGASAPPSVGAGGVSSGDGGTSSVGAADGAGPFNGGSGSSAPALAPCILTADVAARWLAFDSSSTFGADGGATNRDLYLVRADGSQLVRLTTDDSNEMEPAFSNDGTRLAFASDRSGSMQIYVMDLATRSVTQLNSLSGGADQPSWSKDDSQIVFRSGFSVYLMSSDGTNPHVVTTSSSSADEYRYPAMTPDGMSVIFDRYNEIETVKVDGTGFRYVVQSDTTTIETPALSPDGLTVAFAVAQVGAFEQIATVPFASTSSGRTAQTLTPLGEGPARRPAWGPAQVIAFEYNFSATWSRTSIGLVTGPGTEICGVATPSGDNRNPSWAPAGFQPK